MDRRYIYSEAKAWAAAGQQPFAMTFLEQVEGFVAPCVKALYLVFDAVVTVGAGAGNKMQGKDLCQAFSRVDFNDGAGPRLSVQGATLRKINLLEKGAAFSDPADLGVGANQAITLTLEIPLQPRRSRRRADYSIPVAELVRGGKLSTFFNGAAINGVGLNVGVIQSGSIQFYAEITEERKVQMKSRMTWLEYPLGVKNYQYPVQGSLRWLWLDSGVVGANNGRSWTDAQAQAGTPQAITSLNLFLTQQRSDLLRFAEQQEMAIIAAVDPIALNQVIPMFWPKADQKILEMPDIDTAHVQFDGSVPTASDLPVVVVNSITDRAPQLSMKTMDADNINQLSAATDQLGYVKAANGEKHPVQNWPAYLARRMPISLANPKTSPGQHTLRTLASKRVA